MPVHIEGSIYSMKLTSDSVLYELVARPHSLYWNNGSLLHRRQAPRSDIRRMEDGGWRIRKASASASARLQQNTT